jgi:hypothetical protein
MAFGLTLTRSGPCFDSVPLLRAWLTAIENPAARLPLIALRLKFSPLILDRIRAAALPLPEKAALFSGALNLFRGGAAYKTTGAGRTPLCDAAVLAAAAGPGKVIAECGVSDGVSALGLLEKAAGASMLLTDLQDGYRAAPCVGGWRFHLAEGGRDSFKFPGFYFCSGTGTPPPPEARFISLLNPLVADRFPGAKLLPFDLFTGRLPAEADAIKCANVLNAEYFKLSEIRLALANLLPCLKEGGRLFIAQSNPVYKDGEAFFVLRREGGCFALEAETNSHKLLPLLRGPELAGLVRA